MRFLPVNRSTMLIELAGLDEVLALHASLQRSPLAGIKEMLPAARTLLLHFDPACISKATLAAALVQRDLTAQQQTCGPLLEIPMRYDGEDLAEVARLAGLTTAEVIRRHGQSEFSVAFCGFSPGFAYMIGGDPALHVPRRQSPRPQLAAGSVALGGVYCGVYPQASPGGWQIIGTTSVPMWDPRRDPPAMLAPGTRVRFCDLAASAGATRSSVSMTPRVAAIERSAVASMAQIKVLAATLPALVQDLGRAGHAAIGVTSCGALDRAALQRANRALFNQPDLPALEITLGNFMFECTGEISIALAGAPAPVSITRHSGEIFEAALEQAIALQPGDCVKIGYPARGVRSYLAVRGGFEVGRVLGSASRDTLAALGPEPITKGSILDVGAHAALFSNDSIDRPVIDRPETPQLPAAGDIVELDVFAGPRLDWFSAAAVTLLTEQAWRVTPQSNRVGMRLQGEKTLARQIVQELPSEGLTRGAIQVPHDGQPILLLADHPVTGGYPVIAVLAEHHLDLAAQIPPGAKIRFRPIAADGTLNCAFADPALHPDFRSDCDATARASVAP